MCSAAGPARTTARARSASGRRAIPRARPSSAAALTSLNVDALDAAQESHPERTAARVELDDARAVAGRSAARRARSDPRARDGSARTRRAETRSRSRPPPRTITSGPARCCHAGPRIALRALGIAVPPQAVERRAERALERIRELGDAVRAAPRSPPARAARSASAARPPPGSRAARRGAAGRRRARCRRRARPRAPRRRRG